MQKKESNNKKIIIIGAGPGGLASAMILAHRGFQVIVFEKNNEVGGRNGSIKEKGFTFDVGPTFLMMKFVLEEIFKEAGKDINRYLKIKKLNPMYRLQFDNMLLDVTDDHKKMKQNLAHIFTGSEKAYVQFLEKEKIRFNKIYPCLQKDNSSFFKYLLSDFLKVLPRLSLSSSIFQELSKYFEPEKLKISFASQFKYIGMSPWDCPVLFMMIPFVEHEFGLYHTIGGLSAISEAMAKLAKQNKAIINTNMPVAQLIIEKSSVKGVMLENGERVYADETIIGSDFAYSMSKLVPSGVLKKYSRENLKKKEYSYSTFMLYLGLDKIYEDVPHHSIIFSKNHHKFVQDIFSKESLLSDPSFYIRNASVTDKTLAPKGMSNIYIQVPVQNRKIRIDWQTFKQQFRDQIIETIKEKTNMKDLAEHIVYEKIITPEDWENDFNVYLGASFNLAHSINQMLYFRPHNKFQELKNCYLVGGGTHPGSGLPLIYESARITSNLISKKYNIPYKSFNKII